MDVVIVSPGKGRHKEVGRQLLALADHPSQVQWVTWPAAGFSVPVELFEKFEAGAVQVPLPSPQLEAPPAKRRGRPPRKQPETSTDNTTSEEE